MIAVMDVHPANAAAPMVDVPAGMDMFPRDVHSLNAPSCISVTPDGIDVVRELHLSNA